ncbi:CLC_0170 family protein [Clostridium sp.]|uniref:CLC_0170 family protein n=1 Tax=Clostridium sp. TaxID=1506 RepID=UPI002623968E|nr:CLC_0170 family protein [uncultured Clostridium sp.]
MRILDLFDIYFLIMMLIEGGVVLSVDTKFFKNSGMGMLGRKANTLGRASIIIASILFILRWIF